MDDPIAYFITWTCYGTWLPGDQRGWTRWRQGDHVPQPLLADWCRDGLNEVAVALNGAQRDIVECVVGEHCAKRGWVLHKVNCRSNHCHVVVTALRTKGTTVRDQLKAWGTRRLKDLNRATGIREAELRRRWWTRGGSVRMIFDEASLEAAVQYCGEAQEVGGSKVSRQS